ncbi:quinol oxidase subunit 2 [Aneurinibacillus migulanus]|uniref:cytochrome aa3 quinol oxidase subunit II n=1 Tax=Aneurinibacillus migulanus TaxID=47500 RepID=UPI0005B767BB|nr:cytochrome aa3 quinol oxidase subunit II [Aneurinibacillus migulanus]KIV57612.1 quinol oxidase subunit 2 [Aneurinibacillus migulanus]KPD07107.1 quinol oxidase subunit 2 [Aneurinibacillus migulanus]MCP1357675.1 cytochrome aa3 quinol oxidase subunit II [Aneurinibacillus migulanus]CEH28607.1 Cytochrome aa3 quinol oxidase subunit II [Aneurinibacillus migulanus]
MKIKWALLGAIFTIITVLTGCEPLMALDPKGPQAQTQANDIMLSIWIMSFIVIVVFAILVFMLIKYRASKQSKDYAPPHIEGSAVVEAICVGIPVLIVILLSFVSVQSNYKVEATPKGYEDKKPLIVYASTSNWKWHFSYPEEDIETVNYLYIPTDRALEFKLYSYGPITSFWIPQLGGQKYAMSDMITTLHLAADVPGEYMGRNANFSGKGFAENTFNVKAMPEVEFDQWVKEVKKTAKPLTEEKFDELLEPGHLGQLTFTGTHLEFLPPPEGEGGGHNHGSSDSHEGSKEESEHNQH